MRIYENLRNLARPPSLNPRLDLILFHYAIIGLAHGGNIRQGWELLVRTPLGVATSKPFDRFQIDAEQIVDGCSIDVRQDFDIFSMTILQDSSIDNKNSRVASHKASQGLSTAPFDSKFDFLSFESTLARYNVTFNRIPINVGQMLDICSIYFDACRIDVRSLFDR